MQNLSVKELAEKEVNDLFQSLPTSNKFRQGFFGDAFQIEKDKGYTALPTSDRSYYLVSTTIQPETLFGINYGYKDQICISSFARIIEKGNKVKVAAGWQYLKTIFEQVLIPMCNKYQVKKIYARLTHKSGIEAFCELKSKRGLPNSCSIEWGEAGAVYVCVP